jgi:acetate kinase
VMMGTRSGDLDPGVLVFLMRECCELVAKLAVFVEQFVRLVAFHPFESRASLRAARTS